MTGVAPVEEIAPAKVNLVLHVGPRAANGLHEVCSLFASIGIHDVVTLAPAEGEPPAADGEPPDPAGGDHVVSEPPVGGPNLAAAALRAFREAVGAELPPLRVAIDKRIPVAAGLGGGSADAAAVLRAANRMAGEPLDADGLRRLAAPLGSDVPSQVDPRHALVSGTGERVDPVELPAMALVLVPAGEGLRTADVYAEADRIGATRARTDPVAVRGLASLGLPELARAMENDLQAAAVALRPELVATRDALLRRSALVALVSGSGPTVFGVFADRAAAEAAASALDERAIVTETRG